MAGGRKRGQGGPQGPKGKAGHDGAERPRKLPAIEFEDFTEADRIFQESLETMGPLPADATRTRPEEPPRAAPKSAGPRGSRDGETRTVDLHRMTLSEAQAHLDVAVAAALSGPGPVTLMVITGKGLHSGPAGSVLAQEIHRYVRRTYGAYILRIEDSPGEVRVGGVPLRGHFNVTLGPPGGSGSPRRK